MWECPKCGEAIEAPFEVCWNCGTSQDGVQDPEFGPADETETSPTERSPPQFGVWSLLGLTTGVAILLAIACNRALGFLAPVFFIVLILILLHVGIWILYAFTYVVGREPTRRTVFARGAALASVHFAICVAYLVVWRVLPSATRPMWLTAVGYVLLFPLSLLLALGVRPSISWDWTALPLNSCVWGFVLAWLTQLIATRAQKPTSRSG